jgi:hypothetical protein
MPRITISYRRDDSMDITGRIFDRLALHFGREAVFRDIDNIPPGVDFRRHIGRVLDESDVILAIVGPRWMGRQAHQNRLANAADPVRVEIEIALRIAKPLIPVLVSRAAMPSPEQLPESLQDFSYRNAVQIDSGQDFDVHIGRLIRAMEQMLAVDGAGAAAKAFFATAEATPRIDNAPNGPDISKLAVPQAPGAKKTRTALHSEPLPETPATRAEAAASARQRNSSRWLTVTALTMVLLATIGVGAWWTFVEQPAEMARREAAAAENARAAEQARQAEITAKALQDERDREAAAAAAKAQQDERNREAAAAAAKAQQDERNREAAAAAAKAQQDERDREAAAAAVKAQQDERNREAAAAVKAQQDERNREAAAEAARRDAAAAFAKRNAAPLRAGYGALAIDPPHWGISWGQKTKAQAEAAAKNACATAACKIVFQLVAGLCVAVATADAPSSSTAIGAATRPERAVAEEAAIENCQKHTSDGCKVQASECYH